MKISVWSDFTCPFCYIGKRHLEQALKQLRLQDNVDIEWNSFQLDPSIPEDIRTTPIAYLSAAKGISMEDSATMHENVTRMAKASGLNYTFEQVQIANSFRAHRLLQYAKTIGKDTILQEVVFDAYFCGGKNIHSVTDLTELAESCGISKEQVEEAMQLEVYAEAVHADIQKSRDMEVKGVPYFVINNTFALSGAQPVAAFVDALVKATSEKV